MLFAAVVLAVSWTLPQDVAGVAEPPRPPNLVVVLCDDLGFGDLGCFGHPTIRTPNLDRMAREGQKWTSFYVAASVCTPSRAGLLTGRLPIRSGMCSSKRHVLFPNSGGGLPAEEVTIGEILQSVGYATKCVGKWHLGHLPEFLPTRHGFDEFYGVPYSNDMTVKRRNDPPLPLYRDERVIEQPTDQASLTARYTGECVEWIQRNRSRPFFLYLAHTFPHVPLFASEPFRGRSARGRYGDVVEEIDWSIGEILGALVRAGVAERTLVVFTSDNGPSLGQRRNGGSAGLLAGGKATTFEGGMRVPTIAWWPGTVPAGRVVMAMGSTLDLLPTFAGLAGADDAVPNDRVLDGVDLTAALRGTGPSPRDRMFFYRGDRLRAARVGAFKAHFETRRPGQKKFTAHERPRLFRLDQDPSERFEIGERNPDVLERIAAAVAEHRATLEPVTNQLEIPLSARGAGK